MKSRDKLNLLQKIVIIAAIAFVGLVFYGCYLDYKWIKIHTTK